MRKRLNIGLVIDDIDNYFSNQAAKGAEQAAKAIDANLFIFPGHYIGKTDSRYVDKKYEYQYNTIYNIPTERNVDIVYVLQGLICSRADMALQTEFIKSLPDVPVICLFSDFEGYHAVTFDNRSGLTDLLVHLIKRHNVKKIGYVSGPLTNRDARERLEIYKDVLTDNGIQVEENRIVYGDFSMGSEAVVDELLDKNEDLEAIVFANDSMAVGGYNALNNRGLIPGKDILVAGFDDDVFAISLEPALTTVEASSAALAYKALLNAYNYINGNAPKDMAADTHLVLRSSCGCDELDVEEISIRLGFDKMDSDPEGFKNGIKDYLFNIYGGTDSVSASMDCFTDSFADFVRDEENEDKISVMNEQFAALLRTDMFMLSTREKLFNVLQAMQYKALSKAKDDKLRLSVNEVFSKYFRRLAFSGILPANVARRRTERMQGVVSRKVGDILLLEGSDEIRYELLLGGFTGVGISRSLLYLFQGNIKNSGDPEWTLPKSILLKAISDKDGLRMPPEEQQLLRTESIFDNEFITDDERRTMIVSPLFVGPDYYGLLVNEVPVAKSFSIASLSFQLSVTLRSLFMIEEQNRVKQSLQISLERFIRDNTKLEEIAQKDELTGLYNRRGFIANAEKVLAEPVNQGKMAIICYADMDDLKVVNDMYGHDDGDFALRTVSEILRESFRDTDIIGRIGGDEFIALAITGADCNVDSMKARIEKVTKQHNVTADKPYLIGMSTGIYKFTCSNKIDIYDVMNNADRLLYEEKIRKKTGRLPG